MGSLNGLASCSTMAIVGLRAPRSMFMIRRTGMTIYTDPASSGSVGLAIAWLQSTMLGTLASTVAIVAIASIGVLMFTGRIEVRRAAQVVFGCFIVFGASTIASGIMGALSGAGAGADLAQAPPSQPVAPLPPTYPKANAVPYDPYAGAALPPR